MNKYLNKKFHLEARKVMENHLGRKLSMFEIVHHKDKNHGNNNLENLQIMTIEEHNSYHHAGAKHNYPKKVKRWRKYD
ncbi:MAG: HNH endonuclease [Nanoarchaeota archaeon]